MALCACIYLAFFVKTFCLYQSWASALPILRGYTTVYQPDTRELHSLGWVTFDGAVGTFRHWGSSIQGFLCDAPHFGSDCHKLLLKCCALSQLFAYERIYPNRYPRLSQCISLAGAKTARLQARPAVWIIADSKDLKGTQNLHGCIRIGELLQELKNTSLILHIFANVCFFSVFTSKSKCRQEQQQQQQIQRVHK